MKLLTNAEIHSLLTKYAFDVRYKGKNRVPFSKLATLCNVSHETLDRILTRGLVTERFRHRISIIFQAIERGEVRFTEKESIYEEPPVVPLPPQGRMVWIDQWDRHSPCRACAGHRWAKAFLSRREVMVCSGCIPPDQYKALHLDTELKRVYKPMTLSEVIAHKLGNNSGIRLPRLRPPIREHGAPGRGGLPSLHKRRG